MKSTAVIKSWLTRCLVITFVAGMVAFQATAQCSNAGYFRLTQLYPDGPICYSQSVTLKAEYLPPGGGTDAYGEFRWYTSSNGFSTPVWVTDIDYYTTLESLFTVQATSNNVEVRVTYYDKFTQCESEQSTYPYPIQVEPAATVWQVSGLKCGSAPAQILVSSSTSGVTFELYWRTPSGTYSHLDSNTSGYFEVADAHMYGLDNFYVKTTQTLSCAPAGYQHLSIHSDNAAEPYVSGATTYCYGVGTTLTAAGTGSFKWYNNESGNVISTSPSITIPTDRPPGIYSYSVVRTSTGGCVTPPSDVGVLINPRPSDSDIQASSSAIFLGQSVRIRSVGGVGDPYYWCSNNGGSAWNVFEYAYAGQSFFDFTPTQVGTYRFHVRNKTACGFCWEAGNNGCPTYPYVDVVVSPPPVPPTVSGETQVVGYLNEPITISLNVQQGSGSIQSYSWERLTSQPASSVTDNASQLSFTPLELGYYLFKFTVLDIYGLTASLQVTVNVQVPNNYNYIKETSLLVSGMSEAMLPQADVLKKSVSTNYFDGIGRPMQNVTMQGSPSGLDIIQPIVYDAFGREEKRYLPFTAQTNGWYKPNNEIINSATDDYMGIASEFYDNPEGEIADDNNKPFSKAVFEPSPLNRVLKQGAPGEAWQPKPNPADFADNSIKKQFTTNTLNEVLRWTYIPSSHLVRAKNGSTMVYYGPKELYVTKTYDEHNKLTIEYTDKEGRIVLKRVQTTATPGSLTDSNKDTNYASTYYIYDDFGNLVAVIQPEGISKLASLYPTGASSPLSETFMRRWAFRYKYDGRKRMTEKWVPGTEGPVRMVYDNRDRIVLTQDANQRASSTKYWTFTKYDELNRPILTGIKDTTTDVLQVDMQAVIDAHYQKSWAKWGESYIGNGATNIHGYSNKSYPVTTSNSVANPLDFLTVTYYDNYAFKDQWPEDYSYADEGLEEIANGVLYAQPDNEFLHVKGLVTGTKVKVLDGGVRGGYTWLKAVSYYDDHYRMIQSLSDNYKGGKDRTTNVFDFTGKLLETRSTHSEKDITWKDQVGTTVTGNKLIRTAITTSGAASAQHLQAGQSGSLEFIIPNITSTNSFYIGFNDTNPDVDFANINYALYIYNANIQVVENNVAKFSQLNVLNPGDVLKIERVENSIKYSRNGNLLWTSQTSSSGPLMIDVSFLQTNATVMGLTSSFSTTSQIINRRFEYDHAGRLLKTWHQLTKGTDAGPEILLSKNEYNELGQLIDKKLHSTNTNATDAKQSVDYRYNIRGWLTSINNASVTPDAGINDDAGDLFGMELGYNETLGLPGITNAQFNGNISAIKWNAMPGTTSTDAPQKGYAFAYDPMNRLQKAEYKEKATAWSSSGAFNEDSLLYDLNGNIQTLRRKQNGQPVDKLEYNYGTGTAQSNNLLKVTDAGNDTKGFTEVDSNVGNNANDYSYDDSGNLIWDRNKGGTELQKNGEFTNGRADWIVTDPENRFTFANDRIEVVPGTSLSRLEQTGILQGQSPYVVTLDITRTSLTGDVTVTTGNDSYVISASGKTTVSARTAATSFFFLRVSPDFAGYINSVSVKGMMVISYNYLNLPEKIFKGRTQNLTYVYDATGRKLSQTVVTPTATKQTDYAGEFFYENDTIKFINHEEGRIVMTGAVPEYQYHLKDHLGNVRVTFTTKDEVDAPTATLETENASTERSKFVNYDEAVIASHELFDRTSDGTTNETYQATRLVGGNTNQKYGLARSLSVMPGDEISMEVYAKYLDPDKNWQGDFAAFLGQYTSSPPPGIVIDGGLPGSIGSGVFPYSGLLLPGNVDETVPKAFLTWLVFDREFNPIIDQSGFVQIGSSGTPLPKENGTNVAHELLKRAIPLKINKPGYVYIYLSNENEDPVEVFFDDFKVEHKKSPVVQMDDYYPFGLAFNSYSRENSMRQNYLYNGKEKQDELDLGWYDYGKRMYQSEIGRWNAVDPSVEHYESISPYAYTFNNPIRFIDIKGSDPGDVVVIFAGADWQSNRGLGETGNIASSLREQFFNDRGGAVQNFSSTYWNPQTYPELGGVTISTTMNGSLDEATQEAYDYVLKNYASGGRVVVYGYSYGGVLASHLEKRLKENKIQVDFLVTVDAAAGPQNDQVDRVVSENTKENLNIYQTTPSSVGSRGGENKRSDGSKKGITNRVKVSYVDDKGKKRNMSHAVIDDQSATEVIQAILEKLNKKDDKKK